MDLAARNDEAPVLIVGETGTGKGYVARRIHERSPRARAPYVEVNCASLSAHLPRERAVRPREGRVHRREDRPSAGCSRSPRAGTVFLDEVGELAPEVQPKLLKVLEERDVPPARAARPS